jgi:type IV pilus assembly protein PilY1
MLPGSDGVCDLQEALQLTNISTQLGSDHGAANGVTGGSIPTAFLADNLNAKEFAQMIRGYCYATDPVTGAFMQHPSDKTVCNAYNDGFIGIQNDAPELGGFVHSQAAIVPASQFIADGPTGTHRPTVAYLGGLDGMLHAFYVPSDGLDLGYQKPALQTGFSSGKEVPSYNPEASTTFTGHTPYGSFTLTTANALQELWAFVPPGQLPLLQANNAVVDSSPVVIDAYGDFDGSGVRGWHTVLVASAGGNNRELFALDVTNPLKPILIWDLQASFEDQAGLQYAPASLADDDTGLNTQTQAQAFAWQNGCRGTGCAPSNFKLPPLGSPSLTGLYNYSNLGASQSISVAQMRRFNTPLFAAFVATNEPQNKSDLLGSGLFVFAIDVTTGQKVWEFNNPYNLTDDPDSQKFGIGNTPPAGVTLLSKAGNSLIDTAYVGDDEGSLWELDAADGVNVNSFGPFADQMPFTLCGSGQCNFPLSQAYGYGPTGYGSAGAQPISSLSTVFILPNPLTGPLKDYAGQPLLAYGTAGTDTVSGLEPAPDPSSGAFCPTGTTCINGAVHLVPLLPSYHYTWVDLLNTPTLLTTLQRQGVAKTEPVGYPMFLSNGERVYGSIVAAGDQLFFNTTTGSASQIDQRSNLGGSTYRLLLSAASNPLYNYVTSLGLTKVGGAGGTPMLDVATGAVVVVTDKGILRFNPPPVKGTTSGPSVNGRGATPSGLLSWYFRRRGLEY